MSDEFSAQLLALYRQGASDEPDARLDETILRTARRHDGRGHVLRAGALIAACIALAATFAVENTPRHPMAQMTSAPRPGLEDGRARLFLLTLKADMRQPGMAQRPAMSND
jgi:hypothetical protein